MIYKKYFNLLLILMVSVIDGLSTATEHLRSSLHLRTIRCLLLVRMKSATPRAFSEHASIRLLRPDDLSVAMVERIITPPDSLLSPEWMTLQVHPSFISIHRSSVPRPRGLNFSGIQIKRLFQSINEK